jgi:hypothetical protein
MIGAAAAGTRVGMALVAVGVGVRDGVTVGVGVEVFVSVGPGVEVGAGVLVGPVVGVTVVVSVATMPTSLISAAGVLALTCSKYGPYCVPAQYEVVVPFDVPAGTRARVSGNNVPFVVHTKFPLVAGSHGACFTVERPSTVEATVRLDEVAYIAVTLSVMFVVIGTQPLDWRRTIPLPPDVAAKRTPWIVPNRLTGPCTVSCGAVGTAHVSAETLHSQMLFWSPTTKMSPMRMRADTFVDRPTEEITTDVDVLTSTLRTAPVVVPR